VQARPSGLDETTLPGALAEAWEADVRALEYVPVGAGSYHWSAALGDGTRRFVTVDDLDMKPWLGETRDAAFEGLRRAFDTAATLRDAGLDFVVAPMRARDGTTVRRLDARHSVALFPFVDGEPTGIFHHETQEERAAVAALLAQLHAATPAVASVARRFELDIPGRASLETALVELDQPWNSGPFAERARRTIAEHAADVHAALAHVDRLAAEISPSGWVVTHGEPHARNVLRGGRRRAIVDWDTVALAPAERDLWFVEDGQAAGLSYFRLAWDLADLAAYLDALRRPHEENEDTVKALHRVRECVAAAAGVSRAGR
jgi:Phosphotransferase enzyme family